MGRPLFSTTFQTEPLVRAPEPPCPYEKWSHINAFDPDSDEFFENERAVYEAFVDHVAAEQSEDDDEVEERGMVVIRMGSVSPISSEESVSDHDSPMAVGADDPAQYIAQAYRRHVPDAEQPVRASLATRDALDDVLRETLVGSETSAESVVINRDGVEIPDTPIIFPADLPSHLQSRDELPLPPASAPIPVPVPYHQRSASLEDFSLPSFYHQNSPMTPPRHAFHRFSPSPPPTVSPRIYTWAPRRQAYSSTGTSPFTNATARIAHVHHSPALVRVHGVMT